MSDLIDRQAAIEHLKKRLYETALNNVTEHPYYEEMADNMVSVWLKEVPSAQPEIIRCKDCKYFDPLTEDFDYNFCDAWAGGTNENMFCGFAERRQE